MERIGLLVMCVCMFVCFASSVTPVQQQQHEQQQVISIYAPFPLNLCEQFKTQQQLQQGFFGYYDNVALFFSNSVATTTLNNDDEIIVEDITLYDPQKFVYYVLQKQYYDSGSLDSWVQNLKRDLPGVIFHNLRAPGLLLAQVDILQESSVSSVLFSNPSVFAAPLIHQKIACHANDYSELFTQLSKEDPNPYYQSLVDQVNEADLRNFVEYLSGEAAGSPILTRNSLSEGAVVASQWLIKQFELFGFRTATQSFRDDYSQNVIAIWPSAFENNTEVVVIGAHYDSRSTSSTSPTQRAPGANDDGSGTSTLLQIGKIIGTSKVKFLRTIHIVAFSGEEQGLLGSAAYANKLVDDKTDVVAMLQADMIAYQKPGVQPLLGFPLDYTTPALTDLAITAANTYAPGTSTGRNNRCCSDHRSFYSVGFAATDFSDTHGPIQDPAYHQSTDLANREGFSFDQLSWNAKAMFATLLVVAGATE